MSIRVVKTMSLWVVLIIASDIDGIHAYSSNVLNVEKCNLMSSKILLYVESDAFTCSHFEHFVFVATYALLEI
ncbi:hypothetical protein H5410_001028 [Solanum commersonii]|uniref:Secreted protein n=1 Tax=Solanum commersonii TaxID=4109 RepID=A0A9J6AYZ4_SOLCO|nr:hypothetical protein H5410_001028 [Solanum commersonii]